MPHSQATRSPALHAEVVAQHLREPRGALRMLRVGEHVRSLAVFVLDHALTIGEQPPGTHEEVGRGERELHASADPLPATLEHGTAAPRAGRS